MASDWFELTNPMAEYERLVRKDSDVLPNDIVYAIPHSLVNMSDSFMRYSKGLDYVPFSQYSIYVLRPTQSFWNTMLLNAFDALVEGC